MVNADIDTRMTQKLKQGRPPFGVELKIVDDENKELPNDGKAAGKLLVRGAAIPAGYFQGHGRDVLAAAGFFDTGDVANIDEFGTMQITDRAIQNSGCDLHAGEDLGKTKRPGCIEILLPNRDCPLPRFGGSKKCNARS